MHAPVFTVTKHRFSPGKRMRLPTVVVRGDVLESWLTVSDYSRSRLATELGVSKGRISQILTSSEEPSAHLIAKLITLTRLPFDRLFKVVSERPALINHPKTSASSSASSSRAGRPSRDVVVQAQ